MMIHVYGLFNVLLRLSGKFADSPMTVASTVQYLSCDCSTSVACVQRACVWKRSVCWG